MKRTSLILAMALVAAPAFAQKAPPPPALPPPNPQLTELEQTKLQLYDVQLAYWDAMKSPTYIEKQKLINSILARINTDPAHPVYQWHESQGQGDYSGLMKIPIQPQPTPTKVPLAAPIPPPVATPAQK